MFPKFEPHGLGSEAFMALNIIKHSFLITIIHYDTFILACIFTDNKLTVTEIVNNLDTIRYITIVIILSHAIFICLGSVVERPKNRSREASSRDRSKKTGKTRKTKGQRMGGGAETKSC